MNNVSTQNTISYEGFILEYFTHGNGRKVMITLHGFGRDYFDFKYFNPLLENEYKVIGINLFFHGSSNFPTSRIHRKPIEKKEWKQIFKLLLEKEKVNRFSLMAYSMGGKFALTLLEGFSKQFERGIFLAPDGIVINPWYKVATSTLLGKQTTKAFIKSRFGVPEALWLGERIGVFNTSLKKFVEFNTGTKEKRALIYKVWQGFKEIHPNLFQVATNLKSHPTPLTFVLGKRDVAIKPSYEKKINLVFGNLAETHLLNLGHNLFKEPTKKLVENWIKKAP